MSQPEWNRLESLLEIYEQLSTEKDKQNWLAELRNQDVALSQSFVTLIEAQPPTGFMSGNIFDLPDHKLDLNHASAWLGKTIAGYKIVRFIAQGGTSSVFEGHAVNKDYRQRVAIKILKNTSLSVDAGRHFIAEQQALCDFDHPNIAQFLQAGASAEGVHYLVTEFIDGAPVTEFADTMRLSIKARLKLFQQVLSALQYCHSRLHIHRDIKPENILVTRQGVPKLVDFGQVKKVAESSVFTEDSERMYTLSYASPEQIRGKPLDIRTDIFSASVVLHQLLTGINPLTSGIERAQLLNHRLSEKSHTRQRPSAWLTTDCVEQSKLSAIAEYRSTTLARLKKQISGDLDAILSTGMQTDLQLRYATAESIYADIDRFLADEPVSIRQQRLYRFGKFLSKYRVAAGSVGLAFLFVCVAAWQAILAKKEATFAQLRAEKLRSQAVLEKEKAQAVNEFMINAFENASSYNGGAIDLKAIDILEQSVKDLEREFDDGASKKHIEFYGSAFLTIAKIYMSLGFPDKSIAITEKLRVNPYIASTDKEKINAFHVFSLISSKDFSQADSFMNAIGINRKEISAGSGISSEWLQNVSMLLLSEGEVAKALELQKEAVRRYISEGNSQLFEFEARNRLARIYLYNSEFSEALEQLTLAEILLSQQAIKGLRLPVLQHNKAYAYRGLGNFKEAESLFSKACASYKFLLQEHNDKYLSCVENMAITYAMQGKYIIAEEEFKKLIKLLNLFAARSNVFVGRAKLNVGYLNYEIGNFVKSEIELKEAVRIFEESPDDTPLFLSSAHLAYANTLKELGDSINAKQYLESALKIAESISHRDLLYRIELTSIEFMFRDGENNSQVKTLFSNLEKKIRDFPSQDPLIELQILEFKLNLYSDSRNDVFYSVLSRLSSHIKKHLPLTHPYHLWVQTIESIVEKAQQNIDGSSLQLILTNKNKLGDIWHPKKRQMRLLDDLIRKNELLHLLIHLPAN